MFYRINLHFRLQSIPLPQGKTQSNGGAPRTSDGSAPRTKTTLYKECRFFISYSLYFRLQSIPPPQGKTQSNGGAPRISDGGVPHTFRLCLFFIQRTLLIFRMQQVMRFLTACFTQIILIQFLNGFILVR